MSPDEFQRLAHTTAIYPNERAPEYLALGLASEAGEVAGKIKKQIRDGAKWTGEKREEQRRAIIEELGDVLWYVAEICTLYDMPMSSVMKQNYRKLLSRQQRGVLGGDGDNR